MIFAMLWHFIVYKLSDYYYFCCNFDKSKIPKWKLFSGYFCTDPLPQSAAAVDSSPENDKSTFNIATYGVAALAIFCVINAVAVVALYYRMRHGGQHLEAAQRRPTASSLQRGPTAESLSQLSSTLSSTSSSHVTLNTGGVRPSLFEHNFNKPFWDKDHTPVYKPN